MEEKFATSSAKPVSLIDNNVSYGLKNTMRSIPAAYGPFWWDKIQKKIFIGKNSHLARRAHSPVNIHHAW